MCRLRFKLDIKSLIKSQLSTTPGPLKRRLNSFSSSGLVDQLQQRRLSSPQRLFGRPQKRILAEQVPLSTAAPSFLFSFPFISLLSNRETNLLSASLVWPWHHTWRPASAGGRPNEFASFKSSPSAKKRRQRPPRRSLIRHSHHRWRSGGLQPKIGIKIDHVKSLGGRSTVPLFQKFK